MGIRDLEKIRIFKEADIAPQFGPPKWVVWRPLLFERTFDTGDEAIAFAREFLNRVTRISTHKKDNTTTP